MALIASQRLGMPVRPVVFSISRPRSDLSRDLFAAERCEGAFRIGAVRRRRSVDSVATQIKLWRNVAFKAQRAVLNS